MTESSSEPNQTGATNPVPGSHAASDVQPETHSSISIDPNFQVLEQRFREIDRESDPLRREYLLMQGAQAANLELECYRALFAAYEQRWQRGIEGCWQFLQRTGGLIAVLGQFSLLVGLLLFILEADARKRETHTQNWSIVNGALGRTASSGRIEALQSLNQGCQSFKPDGWSWKSELGSAWDVTQVWVIRNFMADFVSLRGVELEGAHLPQIRLSRADLRDARLQNTGLWNADLRGTDLRRAQLQRSRLRDADLQGANLERSQLQGADLAGANLRSADLTDADLTGANLRGVRLEQAIVIRMTMERALYDETLRNSLPAGFKFQGAYEIAPGANLQRALLAQAELSQANLANATLAEADLRGANLRETVLSNANLTGADLSCWQEVDSAGIALGQSLCTDLRDAVLQGARFSGANLQGARFSGANIAGADFSTATGLTLEQLRSAVGLEQAILSPDLQAAIAAQQNPSSAVTPTP